VNLDFVQTLITRHEGFRKTVYTDSKGNPTIGIGFNLADAGAEGTCKAHGLDLQALLAGFPILQIEAVSVRDDAIRCRITRRP
jgi:GH24 family phage-related lysozyme (muramidase)